MKLDQNTVQLIKNGAVGVIPTDTQYGLVGSAFIPQAVEKIYQLKKRSPEKALIVLISDLSDLKLFNITISEKTADFLDQIWPNPVSIILPSQDSKFAYLSRGSGGIAFRLPNLDSLRNFLKISGPIVAPSANLENQPPANTLNQAKNYFKQGADFYIDGGTLISEPSTLGKLEDGHLKILRQGAMKIDENSYNL